MIALMENSYKWLIVHLYIHLQMPYTLLKKPLIVALFFTYTFHL